MVDAGTAALIVDSARSETKRWGGDGPTLTHAAIVLASKWSDEFREVFGEDGRRRVSELLAEQRFRGTESQLMALLVGEPDRHAVLKAIHAAMAGDLAAEADSPQETPPTGTDAAEGIRAEPAGEEAGAPAPALSERARAVLQAVQPTASPHLRLREATEVAAELLRQRPGIPAIVGAPGVGRTAALGETAAILARLIEPIPVWRLAPETIVANPVATVRMLLEDITTPTVLAIDDFDQLADLGTDRPDRDLLDVVHSARLHPHARIAIVLDRRYASRISVISQAFADDMTPVLLTELPPDDIAAIVRTEGAALAASRGMTLDDTVVAAALAPGDATEAAIHPGLALSRIDRACARAVLAGSDAVLPEHLGAATSDSSIRVESHNLALVLESRITGQPAAIARVAERLTITRAGLDLRPERPNGVFLFVGPTGVGKTELAKEIAIHEYGGPDRLIRLDMSEYAHDWSISRLAGPAPGYVGSTEPESWLTTKVAAMPECVVLLDEVEKAHPRVWNTFLQVFDAGRLTDGRGVTAVFSDTVIVMTSNLGVREASSRAIGFGDADPRGSRERILAVVREQMPPELLNRMDDVIVFDPLTPDAIAEIAARELQTVVARLTAAGWVVDVDEGVPAWLAAAGYDPAFGARHLQRNIEQEFLALLARAPSRVVRVRAGDGGLTAEPIP